MTLQKSNDQRRARSGKGLLPPNPRQWENEHNGLDLRDELGVAYDQRLCHHSTFRLIDGVSIFPHGQLPIDQKYIDYFRAPRKKAWSGIAFPVGDNQFYVVYNDSHPVKRIRATLMEEFFHLWLGHPTTTLRCYTDTGAHRSFNNAIENEAYGSGAAALVPYCSLKTHLECGKRITEIADHFEVSDALITFRTKVTRLYRKHKI